ncbi:hypothetical protein DRN73_02975 [Candidatus Pacearchaeota archaeon]|nr:MAG: hypothetical protein DRN73_02975 [Candidatus Pacearchaeota archaeon]
MGRITEKEFILEYFKRHKKVLSLIIFLSVIGAVFSALTPFIYGKLFDLSIIPNTALNFLLTLIALWFILTILSDYLSNKVSFLGMVFGSEIALESESEAYGHFLSLPISFHKKEKRGEILNKISRGSWELQSLFETASEILPQFLMLIFAMGMMFWIKFELAIILMIFFLIYSVFALNKTSSFLKIQKRENKEFEKRYGEVYDKLYNVFLVKNFAMEEKEKENFLKAFTKKLLPVIKKNQRKWTSFSFIRDVFFSTSFVVVLGLAILFLRKNSITPGEFVMFFGYINMALFPLRRIGEIYRNYKRSSVAIKRIVRLKNLIPEKMKHGDKKLKEIKGEILFKDISFSYSKNKEILKDINLKINAGESVALVGKSGVGKTTLSELIIGYYKPKKGKIFLDGVDISKLDLKWLREQIAIVPQDLNLFNDTLLNNLRYASPKASFKKVIEACKAASAHEFIIKLKKGYKTFVGENGIKLSMGQRQRIAIAMAFLKNPKILILDEPTSALDPESEEKVKKSIERLIKDRTTIIIAHRFSTIKKADEIIVLKNGRIVEKGNHFQLIKKRGEYYKLYSLQNKK